jgi:hypothetical protein
MLGLNITLGSLLKTLGVRPKTLSGALLRPQMLSLHQLGNLLPLTKWATKIPLFNGIMSKKFNNLSIKKISVSLLPLMTRAILLKRKI